MAVREAFLCHLFHCLTVVYVIQSCNTKIFFSESVSLVWIYCNTIYPLSNVDDGSGYLVTRAIDCNERFEIVV